MKTRTKKIILLELLALFGWSFNSTVSAQVAYYREVYYSVDTLFLKPKANRFNLNFGGQADINGDASGINVAPYVYAKMRVSRFVVSGLVAMMPGTDYNVQEATVIFGFSGSSEKKKGAKVTTEDMGTNPIQFKTGGKHKCISPQAYSFKTSTEDVSYRGPTMNAPGGTKVTKTTTTTHSGVSNVVQKVKSKAWLNVPKYTVSGLSLGAFNWVRPNNISGIARVSGFSLGLGASITQKARYRFRYRVKENDVRVLGVGKYDVTKTERIHKTGRRVGRVNSSIDFGLEFLYAPIVLFDKPQYLEKSGTDTVGRMVDIKKKNFGGRIRMEIRKGAISMRYEVGLRPGVKAKVGGVNGEDNAATRMMGGAYFLIGFGLGLGLL